MSRINFKALGIFALAILLVCLALAPVVNAWDGQYQHTNMSGYTGKHMGITGNDLANLEQGSWDADKYDVLAPTELDPAVLYLLYGVCPSGIVNGGISITDSVKSAAYHSLMHSYLVDVDELDPVVYTSPVTGVKVPLDQVYMASDFNAPHFYAVKAKEAQTSYRNGQYDQAYEQLGYAMHYVQDLTQPGHVTIWGMTPCDTIYEDTPTSLPYYKTFHGAMEAYTFYNWESIYPKNDPRRVLFNYTDVKSFYFNRVLEQKSDPYYIGDENDAEENAKAVACLSYLSSLYIRDEINRDPNNWMFDPGVQDSIKWLMVEQDKTNMGLVDYVQRPPDS